MYISRGYDRTAEEVKATLVEWADVPRPVNDVAEVESAAPRTLDYHLMHDRLTALERLARLRDSGILSDDEFTAEKARILHLPADELVLKGGMEAKRGPSLLGRILNWKLLLLAGLVGIGFSAVVQPQETQAVAERAIVSLTGR